MPKENTSTRLKYLLKTRNLKQVQVLELARPYCRKYGVELRKNDLSQYVSGKVRPGQERLTILSLALNVSEAWLMGYDVPMERESETPSAVKDNSEGVAENTISFIGRNGERVVKTYTPEQMETIRRLLDAIPSEDSDL